MHPYCNICWKQEKDVPEDNRVIIPSKHFPDSKIFYCRDCYNRWHTVTVGCLVKDGQSWAYVDENNLNRLKNAKVIMPSFNDVNVFFGEIMCNSGIIFSESSDDEYVNETRRDWHVLSIPHPLKEDFNDYKHLNYEINLIEYRIDKKIFFILPSRDRYSPFRDDYMDAISGDLSVCLKMIKMVREFKRYLEENQKRDPDYCKLWEKVCKDHVTALKSYFHGKIVEFEL